MTRRQFPPYRPKRDGRNGGGRRQKKAPVEPKARPHLFTPSGITDPWLGEICASPCDQPKSAPCHRLPETHPDAVQIDRRRVGEVEAEG